MIIIYTPCFSGTCISLDSLCFSPLSSGCKRKSQFKIECELKYTDPMGKRTNQAMTPAGEYQDSFWSLASVMARKEIRTENCLSHLVLSIRRKYIIILIHCSYALKNNDYEKKDSKKRQQKEKRESKKGKEECTRRQICVAPLSESIIGHIGRPQHIPLPLNEYPSTLTRRSYNVCWQKKNYSKMISFLAFFPLL